MLVFDVDEASWLGEPPFERSAKIYLFASRRSLLVTVCLLFRPFGMEALIRAIYSFIA